MKVSDVVAQVSKMDGKSSDEIKAHLEGLTTLARLTGQGEDLKAIKTMIQTEFKGDARAAVDFLKKHGQDPNVANENVATFVNSGRASQFVQAKLGTNGPAMAGAQPTPNPAPIPPPTAPVSSIPSANPYGGAFPAMQTLVAGLIEAGLTAAMTNQKNAGMEASPLTKAIGENGGVRPVAQAVAAFITPKMG